VDRANFLPVRFEEAQAMASGSSGEAVRQINRLFRDGTASGMTDGQLIERFTTRRAEVAEIAFETLVIRHGPMVLRVVKGILRDPHDVEDAFQATFLVLVKKAHAIGERDLLAPWLYGVAHRVALKARGVAARRNKREGGVIDDPPAELAEGPWLDLRPILHEELNRLPDKYKKPVILCHLQGLTHAEAAQELAWPVGTVSVRLTRARKLLKDRLTRRGLTTTATLWAAGLAPEGASAAVPQVLIQATVKAALQAMTGKLLVAGGVSAGAITLSKRTVMMMLMSRLKWLTLPLALAVGAAGGVIVNQQIMIRSQADKAKADVAVAEKAAEVPKPPVASEAPSPEPVDPPVGRPPFQMEGEQPEPPPKVEPPLVVRNGQVELDPPPGYFDLPAPHKNDGTDPPAIKVGQWIDVEVLEALPGRPITGDRIVRPDGTIGLGFYGDLQVAGLNRDQIKVKVLEHLRDFIIDEVLGLCVNSNGNVWETIPPLKSNRVFVDDSINYYKGRTVIPETISRERLDFFEGKVEFLAKELKDLREHDKAINEEAKKNPPKTPAAPYSAVDVSELPDRAEKLESELFKVLKELKDFRAELDAKPKGIYYPTSPFEETPSPTPAAKPPK
jgi:RNA polymerase sigma factor (sigma-70 family)